MLILPDQDLINLALGNDINPIGLEYNLHPNFFLANNYNILNFYYNNINRINQKDGRSYYTLEEIREALNNPHLLHLFHILNLRPWEANQIHPYNDLYYFYRELWDPFYLPEISKNRWANLPNMAFLKIIFNSIVTQKQTETLKKVLQKKN